MDDRVLKLPWRPLHIGSYSFLSKVCFTDSSYTLLLSDLRSMWCEEAEAGVIQERSRDLNKRLKAPVSSFLSHLSQLMLPLLDSEDSDTNGFSCHKTEGAVTLHVKSRLSGLPFYWDFHCKEASVSSVCRHFLQPLMLMTEVLDRKSRTLCLLLGRKDEEIQDYQESGAMLTRGRLKTERFDEESFQEAFLAKNIQELSNLQAAPRFSDQLQRLYSAVTAPAVGENLQGAVGGSGDSLPPAIESLGEESCAPAGIAPTQTQQGPEEGLCQKPSQVRPSTHPRCAHSSQVRPFIPGAPTHPRYLQRLLLPH
ncbi:non-homologous end-joining factor 1 isoform X2 [Ascaphus truei]|uniref:non-homologous end-joining factor 1 isoform X2 n=1 Tax=Ascaphus truei TaxID=8439 RepID=UPI003F5997EA